MKLEDDQGKNEIELTCGNRFRSLTPLNDAIQQDHLVRRTLLLPPLSQNASHLLVMGSMVSRCVATSARVWVSELSAV